MLASVDLYINGIIGDAYGTVEEDTRYYDGNNSRILEIDPAYEITAVEIVDDEREETSTYTLHEDYEQRPLNNTIKSWLHKRNGYWPRGLSNIAITAKFGFGATIPADVSYIATYLIGRMLRSTETGEVKSESIEGYSVTYKEMESSDSVLQLFLDKYKNNEVLL